MKDDATINIFLIELVHHNLDVLTHIYYYENNDKKKKIQEDEKQQWISTAIDLKSKFKAIKSFPINSFDYEIDIIEIGLNNLPSDAANKLFSNLISTAGGGVKFILTGDPRNLIDSLKTGVMDAYSYTKNTLKGQVYTIAYQLSSFKRWTLFNILKLNDL
jgi:hypothetical protein